MHCDTDEAVSYVSVNSGHFCCHSVSRDLVVTKVFFQFNVPFCLLTDINVTLTLTSCPDLN